MVLLIKFLERLYRTLPQFCSVANTQEFIEALAAILFPPHGISQGGRDEEEDSSVLEFDDADEEVWDVYTCTCTCSDSIES